MKTSCNVLTFHSIFRTPLVIKAKVDFCCQKVFTVFNENKRNITSFKRTKKCFRRLLFPMVVFLVILLILFVLWITSRDLSREVVYKHEKSVSLHSDKSTFHYGVVVDCGSSGSRVYIYYWPPHSGNVHELLKLHQMTDNGDDPVRLKIKPGMQPQCCTFLTCQSPN